MRYELLKQYYESPEYLDKLRERIQLLKTMSEDPLRRSKIMLDSFANDPIKFIETIGFLKIPEYNNQIKPFFLFPYQKEIILRLKEAEDLNLDYEFLVDKPRGMGLTWIILWYMYWRWMFTPNWAGFLLSRTETEVDDGTDLPDGSLFGKLRWMIGKTPSFMVPEGFALKGKKGTDTDKALKLINPILKSSLIGSTSNDNAGRSRRYSFIFIDECFSLQYFNKVWLSLQTVSRMKVFVSTVKAGSVYKNFKTLCQKAGSYISLKWTDHPFKDQLWYDEIVKKAEYDPEVMKEIEVNYAISPRSQYYPEIAKAKLTETPIEYIPGRALYSSLDVGRQDLTVIVWYQYDGLFFYAIECYANRNKDIRWYAPFLNPEIEYNPEMYNEFQINLLKRVRSWKKPVAFFGETAHFAKVMPLNKSIADELNACGIRLMCNNNAIKYEPRRNATSQLLPQFVFNGTSDYVVNLYDAIANSRYTNTAISKDSSKKPVHDDEISDYRSALENFCVNLPRVLRNQRSDNRQEGEQKSMIMGLIKYLKI